MQRFAVIGRMLINKGIELSEKVKTWKRKGEGMIVKLVAGVKIFIRRHRTGEGVRGPVTWDRNIERAHILHG